MSGGQTGVDRAALDVAIELGIAHGGFCPQGRRAEDGRIPDPYELSETPEKDYATRTERNVVESKGTLIVCAGNPSGGTALTQRLAHTHGKPHLVVDLHQLHDHSADEVRAWIDEQAIDVLNVAGPRESGAPGIHARATALLREVFSA